MGRKGLGCSAQLDITQGLEDYVKIKYIQRARKGKKDAYIKVMIYLLSLVVLDIMTQTIYTTIYTLTSIINNWQTLCREENNEGKGTYGLCLYRADSNISTWVGPLLTAYIWIYTFDEINLKQYLTR